jgi:signal peptidase I
MKNFIKENLIYIIIIILVISIKSFVVTPVRVRGRSMLNTLKNNDIMILNKLSYKNNDIKRFDIVVVKNNNELIIKRVIGLPGEKISYKNNELYVNGKKVNESFKKVKDDNLEDYTIDNEVVPKGYYFVLGDNRPESADSRIIGYIKKDKILGKCSYIIFPFNRIGKKK